LSDQRLLAIYAHPDDESFNASGSFALLRQAGVEITLICATRGEAGEISDPALATPERLGEVREGELRAAMAGLGVSDIRFLGYRDSGMAGSSSNHHPGALVRADEAALTGTLLREIRALQPDAVLTFGPDGIYGHPDHLMMHRTATAAVVLAAGTPEGNSPALYYNAVPRERIDVMARRKTGPFVGMSAETLARLGTRAELITTVVDVRAVLPRKRAALRAHRTQFGPDGPLTDLPPEQVTEWFSFERFWRVQLPYDIAPERLLLDRLANGELGRR
jgi:N-acetyl-1-D-myo-inositol-2-amino-2-deoxy-alpha-D-glucopyranoside deacetylase